MKKYKYQMEGLIGTVVGSRTIIGEGKRTTSNNRTILVRCVCGDEKEVQIWHFLNGRYSACIECTKKNQTGVLSKVWKGGKYFSLTLYSRWKKSAKRRSIEWDVTIDYLEDLFEKQNFRCAFTGEELTIGHGDGNGLVINGSTSLDRIDSNLGYTEGNVQFVTKDINMAKQKLSNEEFVSMCSRVELFARQRRKGWDAFGNEIEGSIELGG